MQSDNDETMDITTMNNKPSTSSAETSDLEIINNSNSLDEQNEPSTSRKYKPRDAKDKLTRYGKLSIPLVLQSVGCEPDKYEEVSAKMKKRCPDEMELLSESFIKLLKINFFKQQHLLIGMINDEAQKGQKNAEEQIKNKTFQNINDWAKFLALQGAKKASEHELPLVLRTIAELEEFPPPELVEFVDFRELYKCLESLMLGYPIGNLDKYNKILFKSVYKELLESVNSDLENNKALLIDVIKKSSVMKNMVGKDTTKCKNVDEVFQSPGLNIFELPKDCFCDFYEFQLEDETEPDEIIIL